MVRHRAHNPEVAGSNPAPRTRFAAAKLSHAPAFAVAAWPPSKGASLMEVNRQ